MDKLEIHYLDKTESDLVNDWMQVTDGGIRMTISFGAEKLRVGRDWDWENQGFHFGHVKLEIPI